MVKKIVCYLFISCLCFGFFAGCCTGSSVVTTDDSIVSSQISVTRIEAINARFGDILSDYDVFIKRAYERAIKGNYTAEAALDDYDEFVQGLIRTIRELEHATRVGEAEGKNSQSGSGGSGDSVLY